jgi:lipopolysaccharide transport system ATP-binding protein
MSEVVLRFEQVGKRFAVSDNGLERLRQALRPPRSGAGSVDVLRDVNFSVSAGEVVAIIGPNGAGKSTLLHLAAGVIAPSAGTVTAPAHVTSLLELGGSFLPQLTGRENARLYHEVVAEAGALPPVRERWIEEFAAIGAFFDRPLRTYSSGMFLRFAFACVTAEDPDLLLLDEVFAVGDARFQERCFRRLRELQARGTAIVVATQLVQHLDGLCSRALVCDAGRIVYDGTPGPAVTRYYELFHDAPDRGSGEVAESEIRVGHGGASIGDPRASHADPLQTGRFRSGDRIRVSFDVCFDRDVPEPIIGFSCSTRTGVRLYATTSAMLAEYQAPAVAGERRHVEIEFDAPVAVGDLFVDLSVCESVDGRLVVLDGRLSVLYLTIAVPRHYGGLVDLSMSMRSASREPVGERDGA